MRRDATLLGIASATCTQHHDGNQCDPATECVNHDAPREIMKLLAERGLHPVLNPEMVVPRNTLEERIQEPDKKECRGKLWIELCALGDAAGNDRRNRCRKCQQEEEFHQRVTV